MRIAHLRLHPDPDALPASAAGAEAVAATQQLGILAEPLRDVTRWAKGTRAGLSTEPSLIIFVAAVL